MSIPPDVHYGICCSTSMGVISTDVSVYLLSISDNTAEWYDNIETSPAEWNSYLDEFKFRATEKYECWRRNGPSPKLSSRVLWQGLREFLNVTNEIPLLVLERATKISSREVEIANLVKNEEFVTDNCYWQNFADLSSRMRFNRSLYGDDLVISSYSDEDLFIDYGCRTFSNDSTFQQYEKEKHRILKKMKKSLVRSVDLLKNYAGLDVVRDFLNRKPIYVVGKNKDFVFELHSIYSTSWDSIKTKVLDKNGEPLYDLCVYFSGTPAPDQLVAMMMHINAGAEDLIVEKANIKKDYKNPKRSLMAAFCSEDDSELRFRNEMVAMYSNTVLQTFSACVRRDATVKFALENGFMRRNQMLLSI